MSQEVHSGMANGMNFKETHKSSPSRKNQLQTTTKNREPQYQTKVFPEYSLSSIPLITMEEQGSQVGWVQREEIEDEKVVLQNCLPLQTLNQNRSKLGEGRSLNLI